MRTDVLLVAGLCLLSAPAAAQGPATAPAAQTAKPKPPAQGAKPAAEGTKPAERKEIKVSAKALTAYVGEYEMAPERILTITLENGSLWGQPTGQTKRQLFAESQTKFFLKDIDAQVTFQKDPKGKVTGLLMDQNGKQRELKKIK